MTIDQLKLVVVSGMGDNPASVDLDTGVVEVNAEVWPLLNSIQRELILLHELGHIRYDTVDNEELADLYVLERFAGSQDESLRTAVSELLTILDHPHIATDRKKALIVNALEIDSALFGNEHAQELLLEIETDGQRKANDGGLTAAAIVGIVQGAIALVGILQRTILGKRNQWSRGKKSEKTPVRLELVENAAALTTADLITKFADSGELAIRGRIQAPNFPDLVHATMVREGVFKDDSMFTKNWNNPREFFSPKNYGWVEGYIRELVPIEIRRLRQFFDEQGYPDPDKKGLDFKKILIMGAIAIGAFIIIKKLL